MDAVGPPGPCLPRDLILRILALLPPNDLALSGRLAFKAAAQQFAQPHQRTACISQPLPSHAVTNTTTVTTTTTTSTSTACATSTSHTGATTVSASRTTTATTTTTRTTTTCFGDSAEAALKQLALRQKLLSFIRAAASGCEVNVELAWHLLLPHVFPELLLTDHYRSLLDSDQSDPAPDVGSTAVVSGLAHLLPSLAQRCPGLIHPKLALEAAARHCGLDTLQAAWEALYPLVWEAPETRAGWLPRQERADARALRGFRRRVLAAAAESASADATAKMAWALHADMCTGANARQKVQHAGVCGAAAASGDLARLRWLQSHGFPCNTR